MKVYKELPTGFKPISVEFPEHKPNDRLLDDGKTYLLEEDYYYIIKMKLKDDGYTKYRVLVKAGYTYDGFSVPKIARFVQGKHSGNIEISLFHDLDFDTHFSNNLSNADFLLLLGYKAVGTNWFVRNLIYSFLKLGSWAVYPKTDGHIKKMRKFIHITPIRWYKIVW